MAADKRERKDKAVVFCAIIISYAISFDNLSNLSEQNRTEQNSLF